MPLPGPLQHFTGEPRPEQQEVLTKLARLWHTADVFIIRAPVGAGKSRIAHALGSWAGDATICTPTNQLVRQYRDTWPDLPTILRGTRHNSPEALRIKRNPLKVLNYWSYLAHRAYSPVVIFDEAHRLVPTLQDMEQVKVWKHLHYVPSWVQSAPELLMWAQSGEDDSKAVKRLATKLGQHPDTYTLEASQAEYRGKLRELIALRPLTPRHNRPVLWPPSRVKKLVFMSATFHYEDLYDLGLEGRRVCLVECPSPIPADDRPVVYEPAGLMSRAGRSKSFNALVQKLRDLAERHPDERGVVHVTYELSAALRRELTEDRWMFHSSDTRDSTYQAWRRAPGAPILVACGMSEGIDLPGDLCRWQAVAKVAYPDLGDAAVAAKSRLRPDWYSWMAARDLQQAVGRSSRGPGDYSVVYILDSAFERLYTNHRDMFSDSFHQAFHVYGV